MKKNAKIGIYIFRRDLRLSDNLGLIKLSKEVDIIIPIFILDPKQIKCTKANKYYFSSNVVQFMSESLIDLSKLLNKYNSRLRLFYGEPKHIIKIIIKHICNSYKIKLSNIYIGFNCDFSTYAKNRDQIISEYCLKYNIKLITSSDDLTLCPIELLSKSDKTCFKQYGAFLKHISKYKVNKPIANTFVNYLSKSIYLDSEFDIEQLNQFYISNPNLAQNGGRSYAVIQLYRLKNFNSYDADHNILSYNTTNLSAYLNFGCISPRETYYMIRKYVKFDKSKITLIRQLYWRDFYLQVVIYDPMGAQYIHIDDRFNKLKWPNNNQKHLNWTKLIDAETGFLLIDAAMIQMKTTGFMHNRARMLVGHFWTKYLLINIFDPIYGSQVGFSKYLVDAIGCSQNKLNHQWITEFDYAGRKFSKPGAKISGRQFDISNKQITKYDPDCIYIKTWLKHLKNIPNSELIKWNDKIAKKYNYIHPAPIFDSKIQYTKWIKLCADKSN